MARAKRDDGMVLVPRQLLTRLLKLARFAASGERWRPTKEEAEKLIHHIDRMEDIIRGSR